MVADMAETENARHGNQPNPRNKSTMPAKEVVTPRYSKRMPNPAAAAARPSAFGGRSSGINAKTTSGGIETAKQTTAQKRGRGGTSVRVTSCVIATNPAAANPPQKILCGCFGVGSESFIS